jgi:vanillate O-demethylase monooxygenase subunit
MLVTNIDPALRSWWHPVAMSDEVGGQPLAVTLLGQHYVVVRLAGVLAAFPDRCPHRLCPLSAGTVIDGELQCGYHGWRFDGRGACTAIPALGPDAVLPPKARIDPLAVQERHGLVFLAPEAPRTGLMEVPEWDQPGFEVAWVPPVRAKVAAGTFVDNFLDVAHFPFVHAGTFGASEEPSVGDIEVRRDGWGFDSSYDHVIDNHEDPKVLTGEHPLRQPRRTEYSYTAPFSVRLRLELPMPGTVNLICVWIQPETLDSSRIYCAMVRDDIGTVTTAQAAVDYELAVLAEDLLMLEAIEPRGLPIGLAEVHTRADRSTIELRRILAEAVTRSSE